MYILDEGAISLLITSMKYEVATGTERTPQWFALQDELKKQVSFDI